MSVYSVDSSGFCPPPSSPPSHGSHGKCGIYVDDAAKGSVVHSAHVASVKLRGCDAKAVLAENWLVHHHDDDVVAGFRDEEVSMGS